MSCLKSLTELLIRLKPNAERQFEEVWYCCDHVVVIVAVVLHFLLFASSLLRSFSLLTSVRRFFHPSLTHLCAATCQASAVQKNEK